MFTMIREIRYLIPLSKTSNAMTTLWMVGFTSANVQSQTQPLTRKKYPEKSGCCTNVHLARKSKTEC